ncbi:ras GTPase-activating protein-binding protein 2-like [Megalops cyprinoides]|uniref:ras GTPase-activating protein-binding protein 2-like n=1 Tax=Megalops cyprinoides TaxID=118141 RepID=UPI0018648C49|nr:ras GTPase-activating protein-binding protein 2-like [Megalops cyprinoides]
MPRPLERRNLRDIIIVQSRAVEREGKSEQPKPEMEEEVREEQEEKVLTPVPVQSPVHVQEPPKKFFCASVTCKNLPPNNTIPSSGIPTDVVKGPSTQPIIFHGKVRLNMEEKKMRMA